jgi:hypothetical protein
VRQAETTLHQGGQILARGVRVVNVHGLNDGHSTKKKKKKQETATEGTKK